MLGSQSGTDGGGRHPAAIPNAPLDSGPPPSVLGPVPQAPGGTTRPQTSVSTPMAIAGISLFLSVGISQRITGRVAPVGISQRIAGRAALELIAGRVPPRLPSAGAASSSVLLQSEGA